MRSPTGRKGQVMAAETRYEPVSQNNLSSNRGSATAQLGGWANTCAPLSIRVLHKMDLQGLSLCLSCLIMIKHNAPSEAFRTLTLDNTHQHRSPKFLFALCFSPHIPALSFPSLAPLLFNFYQPSFDSCNRH